MKRLTLYFLIFAAAVFAVGAAMNFESTQPENGDSSLVTAQKALAVANGKQLTPSLTVATVNGTIAAGAKSVVITPSADFTGSILGATITVGAPPMSWPASYNNTIAAIPYTRTAGSLTITQLR